MAKRLISLFLIVLIIYACAPKPKSYESATKWHGGCNPSPMFSSFSDLPVYTISFFEFVETSSFLPYTKYHPGDYIKAEDDFENAIKEGGCVSECRKKYVCSEERGYASCVQNRNSCIKSCNEEIIKAHSVASHIEGGHYSDGSYYAGCHPLYFTNIHPTADKYKKTEWQTDRDDCMKLTSESVKPSFWTKTNVGYTDFLKSANGYYKSCLKERGYLN